MFTSIIYGPVPSWRLGKSLGIDLLSTPGKTCSFDCIYCQLGRTANPATERREFVSTTQLAKELEGVRGITADYATFSGMGEPTLASNLAQAIEVAKAILSLPIAILTNSSLMPRKDVRDDLAEADVVVAKLDAHNQELFSRVNRPTIDILLSDILQGIELFRREFKGKLCLQIMFVEANKNFAKEIAKVANSLSPDEVQLNTPLRPCPVKPLTPSEMASIQGDFDNLGNVVMVYQAPRPEVVPLNLYETLQRRPKLC
jgi:wyosine [tRNA(Phe)-imidazoG37] synthetase (radical SAM superfamily)